MLNYILYISVIPYDRFSQIYCILVRNVGHPFWILRVILSGSDGVERRSPVVGRSDGAGRWPFGSEECQPACGRRTDGELMSSGIKGKSGRL
jgi:hypothetical protein